MRASQKITFNKKTGFIERMDLKIYPDDITVLSSTRSGLYLLDAIKKELIRDNKRALKEIKDRKKIKLS